MNILVVGGAGYLGGAVTDTLMKSKKYNVRVYDALFYEESYLKPVDFVYGDIRDTKKLQQSLDWSDAVIWLAALVGDGACALNPEISYEINEQTVKYLSRKYKKRILFMSTCSVYGAQHGELHEDSPIHPLSVYAATKLDAEKHLKNSNALLFRLGTLYGLGDTFSRIRMDLVVNTLSAKAFTEKKLKVFGGDQYRPILHVKDTAQVIVDNIPTNHTGIFNLKGENIKILDLAHKVQKQFPESELETVAMHFQDTRNYRVSDAKARKVLGFRPRYTSEDGVKEMKKLLTQHRIKDINSPRYTNQLFLSMYNTHIIFQEGAYA